MAEAFASHSRFKRFVADYGMIFVLLVLVILFSLLTIKEHHPNTPAAGESVAEMIHAQKGKGANVVIVTRGTEEDKAFAEAATKRGAELGLNILGSLGELGSNPRDIRVGIEAFTKAGETIDAVAVIDAVSDWGIWAKIEGVGREKLVKPDPYTWPTFLLLSNLLSVSNQTAIYAIIAIGMTMVIITAGIDLSVGSLVALSSVVVAILVRDMGNLPILESLNLGAGKEAGFGVVLISMVLGVGMCALAGLFTGVMFTKFRVPPFISTLGMMSIASGLAYRLADSTSISQFPESFRVLGGGSVFGVPNPVWLMIGLYIAAHIVMSRMKFGRYVYAVGGNREAARLSGVPVNRIYIWVYVICGALAGFAGIVQSSQQNAGDPDAGKMYELNVIAAVVVGGTSLMGGEGKIFGTLIGAFIIAVIGSGMNHMNIETFDQKIVLGAVLVVAVMLDMLKRRGTVH